MKINNKLNKTYMDNQIVLTLDSIKQKLYSLFFQSDYEFKKCIITDDVLPKLDDEKRIICRQQDGKVIIVGSYNHVLEFAYYEDIVVIDKKLLHIIDNTIQFLLNYSDNINFTKEIINYISSLLDYDISSRYDVFLYWSELKILF